MNFAANDVRPAHPAKPLQVAQTIFNALRDGSPYEAELVLGFGPAGRTGMRDALQSVADDAPQGLIVRATFERAVGATT